MFIEHKFVLEIMPLCVLKRFRLVDSKSFCDLLGKTLLSKEVTL